MKLKQYIETYGIKILHLAKMSKVNRKTISRILRGGKTSLNTAREIIKATDGKVTMEDLFVEDKRT